MVLGICSSVTGENWVKMVLKKGGKGQAVQENVQFSHDSLYLSNERLVEHVG